MKLFVCESCGWEYDEIEGDAEHGIEPGTKFSDFSDNFTCPLCAASKDTFSQRSED